MTFGQIAYEAYADTVDHKNWQGKPMRPWGELPTRIQEAWEASATAIRSVH